jgi:hypothetical protein
MKSNTAIIKTTILGFFFLNCFSVFSGTIVIEGMYQNKNLYIQNSQSAGGVGFCAYEVLINGQVTTDEILSNTFEIDFSALPIEPGAKVVVEIKHKSDCAPKVLNPDVLKPQPTFEMVEIKVDINGLLNFTTINEQESIPFIIEQYRWNKWIKIAEIQGKGKKKGVNNYVFQTIPHSGENKFRVKQVGFGGAEKRSESVTFKSKSGEVSYDINRESALVSFTRETLFEVYNMYGNVVKYGYGKELNVQNLPKGSYYLCYDNLVKEFTK